MLASARPALCHEWWGTVAICIAKESFSCRRNARKRRSQRLRAAPRWAWSSWTSMSTIKVLRTTAPQQNDTLEQNLQSKQYTLDISHFFFATASTPFSIRPTNVVFSFLHPSSFHNKLSHDIAVRVCPQVAGLPPQHNLKWFQSNSFLPLLTLVSGRPFPSNRPSWHVSEASSYHPAGGPLSCPPPPVPQIARRATAAT